MSNRTLTLLLIVIYVVLNSCTVNKKLTCWIGDHNFEVGQPTYWDGVEVSYDSVILEKSNNSYHFAYQVGEQSWKKELKAHHEYNKWKRQIPYEFANAARALGDHQLDLQITKGILFHRLNNRTSEKDYLNSFYGNIANSYHELGQIDSAKHYYGLAAIKPEGFENDGNLLYQVKQAKEKLAFLSNLPDKEKYITQRNSFRTSVNARSKLMSDPVEFNKTKERLKGFMWTIEEEELTIEELALLDLIHDDWESEGGKIFTSKMISEVKQTLKDYHEGQESNFEIKPSGVIFPQGLSNEWEMQFDGKDFEIVHVTFNRWEMTYVTLSD